MSTHFHIGRLPAVPALDRPDLLAAPVVSFLQSWARADEVGVAEIDADLADTAAFCAAYDVLPAASANCVIVAGLASTDACTPCIRSSAPGTAACPE